MNQASWKRVTLGDICSFKYGKMPKKSERTELGYPMFSGYGIVGFADKYHYEHPEVIVVARGVGGTGDVKMSPPKCFLTNLSIAAQITSKAVDKQFLYYRLQYPSLWELRTGSAQAQITINHLERYETEIPKPSTQLKIASILSAYDTLIENNTRRIAILEEMAQAIYREWFVNYRFPGHENAKLVDSSLGQLPEGWQVMTLGKVASVNSLGIKKGNEPEHINYIDIKSVSTGRIDETRSIPFSEAPSRARRVVRHGDTIWSTVRPNLKAYSIILDPPEDSVASTGFAVLTPNTVPFSFLYFATTTEEFTTYLVNHATGSAYPAVNTKDFENAELVVPPKPLIEKFHKLAGEILIQANRLLRKNGNLRETRDLLLPKLISGKLDVEDLDIDTGEPTEELEEANS